MWRRRRRKVFDRNMCKYTSEKAFGYGKKAALQQRLLHGSQESSLIEWRMKSTAKSLIYEITAYSDSCLGIIRSRQWKKGRLLRLRAAIASSLAGTQAHKRSAVCSVCKYLWIEDEEIISIRFCTYLFHTNLVGITYSLLLAAWLCGKSRARTWPLEFSGTGIRPQGNCRTHIKPGNRAIDSNWVVPMACLAGFRAELCIPSAANQPSSFVQRFWS